MYWHILEQHYDIRIRSMYSLYELFSRGFLPLISCITAALSTSCLFIFLHDWLKSSEQPDRQQLWENIHSLPSLLAAANERHLADEK